MYLHSWTGLIPRSFDRIFHQFDDLRLTLEIKASISNAISLRKYVKMQSNCQKARRRTLHA